MITKEQAFTRAEAYIKKRGRRYDLIDNLRIRLTENEKIDYGKLEGELRDIWAVPYEIEGYDVPFNYFIIIDAETGKVLYTIGSMVYVEDYEEEGFE